MKEKKKKKKRGMKEYRWREGYTLSQEEKNNAIRFINSSNFLCRFDAHSACKCAR